MTPEEKLIIWKRSIKRMKKDFRWWWITRLRLNRRNKPRENSTRIEEITALLKGIIWCLRFGRIIITLRKRLSIWETLLPTWNNYSLPKTFKILLLATLSRETKNNVLRWKCNNWKKTRTPWPSTDTAVREIKHWVSRDNSLTDSCKRPC